MSDNTALGIVISLEQNAESPNSEVLNFVTITAFIAGLVLGAVFGATIGAALAIAAIFWFVTTAFISFLA